MNKRLLNHPQVKTFVHEGNYILIQGNRRATSLQMTALYISHL